MTQLPTHQSNDAEAGTDVVALFAAGQYELALAVSRELVPAAAKEVLIPGI